MSLHGKIMNIQRSEDGIAGCFEYKIGHRDARHAAAELAVKYEAVMERMAEVIKTLDASWTRDIEGGPYGEKADLLSLTEECRKIWTDSRDTIREYDELVKV